MFNDSAANGFLRNYRNVREEYAPVWGFETDKYSYADVAPEEVDKSSLTWRDYTITNDDEGEDAFVKIKIGYDDDGRIANVIQDYGDGTSRDYSGREGIKRFFSMFDRDATNYTVRQEQTFDLPDGTKGGAAAIIYDSKSSDTPFIPSMIFKNRNLSLHEAERQQREQQQQQQQQAPAFFTNYRGRTSGNSGYYRA